MPKNVTCCLSGIQIYLGVLLIRSGNPTHRDKLTMSAKAMIYDCGIHQVKAKDASNNVTVLKMSLHCPIPRSTEPTSKILVEETLGKIKSSLKYIMSLGNFYNMF